MVIQAGKFTPQDEDFSEEQIKAAEQIRLTEDEIKQSNKALRKDPQWTTTDYMGDDMSAFLSADDLTAIPDMEKPYTTRKVLLQNPQFISGARDFLKDRYIDAIGTGLIGGRTFDDASDEEIFDKWLEHFRAFDSNIATTALDLNYVTLGKGATELKQKQYGYLYNNYRLLKGEWQDEDGSVNWGGATQAFLDYGEGMITDPTNWITAIPLWGQAQKVGAVTAHQGMKAAVRNFLLNTMGGKNINLNTANFLKGTAIGTGFGGLFSGLSQGVELNVDVKDEFDWEEFGITTGVSGLFGGVLRSATGAWANRAKVKNEKVLDQHKQNYKKNLDDKYESATANSTSKEIAEIDNLSKEISEDLDLNEFFKGIAEEGARKRKGIAEDAGVKETVQEVSISKKEIPTEGTQTVKDVESPLTVSVDVGDVKADMAGTVRNISAMAIDLIKTFSPEDAAKYLKGTKKGKGKTGPKDVKISHAVFRMLNDGIIPTEQYGQFLSKYGLSHNDFKALWWSTVSDAGKILKAQQQISLAARKRLDNLDALDPAFVGNESKNMAIARQTINNLDGGLEGGNQWLLGAKNILDIAKGSMVVMPSTAERNFIGSMYKVTFRGLNEMLHDTVYEAKNFVKRKIQSGVKKDKQGDLFDPIPEYGERTRASLWNFVNPKRYQNPLKAFKAFGALYDSPGQHTLARGILGIFDGTSAASRKNVGLQGYGSYTDELFTNYIEIEGRRTMENSKVDAVFRGLDEAVYAANVFNRTQEYGIRSLVFNDTLDRMVRQSGNVYGKMKDVNGRVIENLRDLVASGKMKDVVDDDMLAKSINEALDVTYAKEPPNSLRGLLNFFRFISPEDTKTIKGLKLAGQILVPFPRFMYNAAHTALRYSPLGMLQGGGKLIKSSTIGKGKYLKPSTWKAETRDWSDWTKFNEGLLGTAVIWGNFQARLNDVLNNDGTFEGSEYERYWGGGEITEAPYDITGNKPSFFGTETNKINVMPGVQTDLTPFFPIGFHNSLGKLLFDLSYRRDKINLSQVGLDVIRSTFGSSIRTGTFGEILTEISEGIEQDVGYTLTQLNEDNINDISLETQESIGQKVVDFLTSDVSQKLGSNVAPRVVPFMVSIQAIEDIWSNLNPEESKARETSVSVFTSRLANRIPEFRKYLPEKQSQFQETTPYRPGGVVTQLTGLRFYETTPWVKGELERLGVNPYKALGFRDGELDIFTPIMRAELGRQIQPIASVGIPLMLVNDNYLQANDVDRKFMLLELIGEAKQTAYDNVRKGDLTQDIYKARQLGQMTEQKAYEWLSDNPGESLDYEKKRLAGEILEEDIPEDISKRDRRVKYTDPLENREKIEEVIATEEDRSDIEALMGRTKEGEKQEFTGGLLSPK